MNLVSGVGARVRLRVGVRGRVRVGCCCRCYCGRRRRRTFSLKELSQRRSASILASSATEEGPSCALAFLRSASVIRCLRSSSVRCWSRSACARRQGVGARVTG